MRMRTAALLLGVVVLAGFWLFGDAGGGRNGLGGIPQPLTRSEVGELELGGEEGEGASPAGEWLYVQTVGPEGAARIEAYARALEQAAALREETRRADPRLAAARWAHAGPAPRGGRVADVVVDPTSPESVFAAAAAGGVWRSSDGGLTWTPSWPADLTQAMGAIAAGGDGTLYAGTGDPVPTRGFVVSGGSGLYRSRDGGDTWTYAGLGGSGSIGRIAVDPDEPGRVFVAATGSLFVPGGERGLYRSTDGGDSWDLVLAGESPTTGAVDVAIDPRDPRNLLAAMWDRDGRRLAGPGSGLYASTDGGDSWREARLPGYEQEVGRIGVTYAPSDPSRAYAIVSNDSGGEAVGLWRSDDGGRTWRRTAAAPDSLSQSLFGWWFGRIWTDPADADRLFVGGLSLVLSEDGGETVTSVGLPASSQQRPPISQHAMAWDNRSGLVYLGTDGGMLRSVANGATGTWVGASSQGWTQSFKESGPSWTTIDPALTEGTSGPPPEPYGTLTTVAEARSDPDVSYMGTAEGDLWRTEDRGGSWTPLRDGDKQNDLPGTWVTRVEVDPSDADVAYAVFSDARPTQESMRLVETRDGGSSWRDLTGNLPSAPVNDLLVLPGGGLAAGTDVGVFLSGQDGTWLSVGSNLPRVPVLEVRFHSATRTLTAATFGHGLQRVMLP
ncbi:MAG: WD40/YVTN/BNR-like repeat-containing protein [Actinomycetota bacterium]